jgi:uncharacterized membrane protein (GlpM family)
MEFIIKAILGGIIVASVVSAAQKGNPTIGALILGVPLGSIISVVFMYYSGVQPHVFSQLAKETILFVAVSLVFFPVFAYMVMHYGFWISLSTSIAICAACLYILLLYISK